VVAAAGVDSARLQGGRRSNRRVAVRGRIQCRYTPFYEFKYGWRAAEGIVRSGNVNGAAVGGAGTGAKGPRRTGTPECCPRHRRHINPACACEVARRAGVQVSRAVRIPLRDTYRGRWRDLTIRNSRHQALGRYCTPRHPQQSVVEQGSYRARQAESTLRMPAFLRQALCCPRRPRQVGRQRIK